MARSIRSRSWAARAAMRCPSWCTGQDLASGAAVRGPGRLLVDAEVKTSGGEDVWACRVPGVCPWWRHAMGCGWSGRLDGVEGDLVAEVVELADELAGLHLGAATHEPVSAQVAVGDATVQDVVGGDQDRVADRLGRLGRAAAAPQPLVLRGEVGVLGPPGGLGCLGQVRAQPLGALAGPAGALLAGRLVLAGAHARPGGQARGRAEPGHVDPELGDQRLGGAPV